MSGQRVIRALSAAALFGWLSVGNAHAQNTLPLVFGMTPQDAAIALGVPLQYLSGPPRAEIYATLRPAGIPGFYPSDEGVVMQFRRNKLTGWRKTWQLRSLWPL